MLFIPPMYRLLFVYVAADEQHGQYILEHIPLYAASDPRLLQVQLPRKFQSSTLHKEPRYIHRHGQRHDDDPPQA